MGEAGPARGKVTKDLLSNLLLNPVTPFPLPGPLPPQASTSPGEPALGSSA